MRLSIRNVSELGENVTHLQVNCLIKTKQKKWSISKKNKPCEQIFPDLKKGRTASVKD
jgi:hypothetical protein